MPIFTVIKCQNILAFSAKPKNIIGRRVATYGQQLKQACLFCNSFQRLKYGCQMLDGVDLLWSLTTDLLHC